MIPVIFCSTFYSKSKHKNARIDLTKVKKIKVFAHEYTNKDEFAPIVNFFNSFILDEKYDYIDCQRPFTEFIIFYKDGSKDFITQ